MKGRARRAIIQLFTAYEGARAGAGAGARRTVENMSNDEQAGPDPYAEHPEDSIFPGAGRRVSDEERQAALDAAPGGNATVGDTVDSDAIDSSAHETGPGSDEVAEQAEGGHQSD